MDSAIPPGIALITGPRIIGFLFHYGLFGALTVQVYLYYLAFPKDPVRNKALVYGVYALELVQTGMLTHSAFTVFGSGYGDFSQFNKVGLAWFEVPMISGIVAFVAEAFYAYRISVLARSYWVAGLIFLLALVQLAGAIAAGIVLKKAVLFSRLLGRTYTIAAGIWNGGGAVCDIIISVCMTYYLWRRGSQTMASTHVLLKRVVVLVIETGTITAAVAIINLFLSSVPTKGPFYLAPSETIAKFYSNSMMVVLNSRMKIGMETSSSMNDTAYSTSTSRGRFTLTQKRLNATNGHTDTATLNNLGYEMSPGVKVTREQVVFPGGSDSAIGDAPVPKAYLV